MEAIRKSTNEKDVSEKALREVLAYLLHEERSKNTPELGTNVHRIVKKITGNGDPYRKPKEEDNRLALDLYPKLKQIVKDSEDQLLTAVKIAISGNAVDFGPRIEIDIEKEVQNMLQQRLAINDIDQLEDSVLRTKRILYLADNAGETFFDRILIEELAKIEVRVTYVVKDAPILNDATFQDAAISGVAQISRVISTGTDCTGILFNECSDEFLEEFKRSKLVVSKGQGNYESLNDASNKEIFFLLKVKCPLIADSIGYRTGSLVLKRFFTKCVPTYRT